MKRPLTKRYCDAPFFLADSGLPTKPLILTSDVSTCTGSSCSLSFLPKMPTMRCKAPPAGSCIRLFPLLDSVKVMEGLTNAMRSKSWMMLFSSVWFDLRNFRLAGTLKKRLLTRKLAPTGHEHTSCETRREPSMHSCTPKSCSAVRVVSLTCATAAMEGRASPRKPIVRSVKRSSAWAILDVA